MKRYHPLPEAIDGKPWQINGTSIGASVDLKSRVILVPIDDTPESLFLRAHEQGHCAITPAVTPDAVAKKEGVTVEALQICEDARVHWFLERSRVDRSAGGLTAGEVESMLPKLVANNRALGAALVATHGTGDHGKICRAVKARIELAEEGAAPCPLTNRRYYEIYGAAADVLKRVRDVGKGRNHPAHSRRGFARNTVPAAVLFDQYFGAGGMFGGDEPNEPADKRFRERFLEYDSKLVPWGTMSAPRRLPMSRPRRLDRRGGRSATYRDEGAQPNAIHRWATDGRIFRRQRPAPGGTVLIDVSGSMSLSADDVEAIVTAAPAAAVAIYAGHRESGGLRVVAAGGKVAAQRDIAQATADLGGGNVVDGPALRWLLEQPAPRIWVCDGWVTGRNEKTGRNLVAEAYALCRRGNVERVDRAEDVADMIGKIQRRR